jgi:hypothetical protein
LRADLRNRRSPGERAQNHAEKNAPEKVPFELGIKPWAEILHFVCSNPIADDLGKSIQTALASA